ncbi:hypothetical protein PR202_ga09303 [Eleusine coracana subsp. coracana]|uniref:Uncharacterized protein n=1 Tax=Eleusine coracana subsp. coracana TaxID=191504 RepID=A0AAV5C2G7_ELECO|nr:hypothetical protein PR202_ga09303 [Eleusine coracana subsp. coracana]
MRHSVETVWPGGARRECVGLRVCGASMAWQPKRVGLGPTAGSPSALLRARATAQPHGHGGKACSRGTVRPTKGIGGGDATERAQR